MKYTIERLTKENQLFFVENSIQTSNYDYIDDFINDKNTVLYFAKNDTEVCGVVYGYVLTRLNTKPMLYIHSMDVYQQYRKKGIGTTLMNAMLDYANKLDLYKTFLITNKSNNKAVGLYKKVGGKVLYEDDVVFEYKEVERKRK